MLDVIGAGFGRTGTLSLKDALELLGFGRCHHMEEMLNEPESVPHWERAVQGQDIDWELIYGGFRSTVDWPGARFWRELTAFYPSARVILSTRDPQRWYDSAFGTIYQSTLSRRSSTRVAQDPTLSRLGRLVDTVIWDGTFQGRFADREYAQQVLAEHEAAVRQEVPADRLLVYEVGQGWQPLCDFLGVPVPDEPFPELNARAAYNARIHRLRGDGGPSASNESEPTGADR
jgi:sulfotransferase family protein